MATPAQIEANRANALKSTGPRSQEGKEASRRNALKHGLAARTLVLPGEEAEAIAARVAAWSPMLNPRSEQDAWLVEEVVVHSLRIDRCRALETAHRTRSADRAARCWDEDRDAEAEELGAKLNRSPSLVSRQLRRSKQGCAWLLARWEGLRSALAAKGEWDEAQERLALDLLGTPKELRVGPSRLDGDRLALVADQLARLEALQAGAMVELDELDRADAEVGLGRDLERPLGLIRRYEAASVRRMDWARKQIGQGQPTSAEARPASPALPEPAAPRIEATAAIDLTRLARAIAREADAMPTPSPLLAGMAPSRRDILKAVAARVGREGANRQERRAQKARNRRA